MDSPKIRTILIPLGISAIGWVAAPFVKAHMDGTPLNGLPGIWRLWKDVAIHPVPAWAGVSALVIFGLGIFAVNKLRKRPHSNLGLSIVVLSTPKPFGHIGAMAHVPILNVSFHAKLAHRLGHSLEIVSAHLNGTTCEAPFFPIIVSGPYNEAHMIHIGVCPIIVKDGESLNRKVVLVDQFGEEHWTKELEFLPGNQARERFNSGGNPIQCFFCGDPISMMELSETAAIPAHKR